MRYKLSKYLIIAEVDENQYIFFSTRTSNKFLIYKNTYDDLLEGNFQKLENELYSSLIESCILIPEIEDELKTIIDENNFHTENEKTLYQVIMPSKNCQLGCNYCGQDHVKGQMDEQYHNKFLDRVNFKIDERKYDMLSISWFGGEPLMGLTTLKKLSTKLQKIASDKRLNYKAKMVTNGLVLKKNIFLDLVNNHKIKRFEITLDGTEEYHDKRRHLKSGEKSFDIIFNNLKDILNIENFKSLGVNISIRCNVDKSNYASVKPLLRLIKENNLHDKISHFYVAPIHSWGNDAHLQSLEKEIFSEKEISWMLEQHKLGFNPSILPVRSYSVCMATSLSSELIDANGDIYNCTEVSYVPSYKKDNEYLLGKIQEIEYNTVFNNRPFSNWNDLILQNKSNSPCSKCPVLPMCGGMCPKSWKEGNIACPPIKYNIKDKLILDFLINQHNIDVSTLQ